MLADGSGSYPDVARANEIIAAWGFDGTVPGWPAIADLTSQEWSFRDCSSTPDGTSATSSSPATTTPTTRTSALGTRSPASPRKISWP